MNTSQLSLRWLLSLFSCAALTVSLVIASTAAGAINPSPKRADKFLVMLGSLVPYAPKDKRAVMLTVRAGQIVPVDSSLGLPIAVRIMSDRKVPLGTYDVQILDGSNKVISNSLQGDNSSATFVNQRIQVDLKAIDSDFWNAFAKHKDGSAPHAP